MPSCSTFVVRCRRTHLLGLPLPLARFTRLLLRFVGMRRAIEGLVLFACVAARADVLPPQREAGSQVSQVPRPASPAPCVRRIEDRQGPRGAYREVTLPVVQVHLGPPEVTPASARRQVVRWLGAAALDLERCYRLPDQPLTPGAEARTLHLLFTPGGALREVLGLDAPQGGATSVDAACVREWLKRRGALPPPAPKPVTVRLTLSFATSCPTLTCPAPPDLDSAPSIDRPGPARTTTIGRPSRHCPP